jgi:hypothetical protein
VQSSREGCTAMLKMETLPSPRRYVHKFSQVAKPELSRCVCVGGGLQLLGEDVQGDC